MPLRSKLPKKGLNLPHPLNIIRKLVKDSTFVLIQEHWMYEKQFIEKVNDNLPNVDCIVSSPMDENLPRVGGGKGGVAILWKK